MVHDAGKRNAASSVTTIDLTKFNNSVIQGAPYLTADKEDSGLSRVHLYHHKCVNPYKIIVYYVHENINSTSIHTTS